MQRYYFASSISEFFNTDPKTIIGQLVLSQGGSTKDTEVYAWKEEILILKNVLRDYTGKIYLEYSIPRMGKRIDAVCVIGSVIFILEFKVGEQDFQRNAIDQVVDYALDLKNFHKTSHACFVAPILVATIAKGVYQAVTPTVHDDKLLEPIRCNKQTLRDIIQSVLSLAKEEKIIDPSQWETGGYHPTPTIIEAAMALYRGHSVQEISRSDAGAKNLSDTTQAIHKIIQDSKENRRKSICFVTGVPGAGKTLVGLNIATLHMDHKNDLYSVFLSGNGPLVAILREALTRDRYQIEKENGISCKKGKIMSEVKSFIQNIYNFRDECRIDGANPPIEHVALFDEAQRAWDLPQIKNFMNRKKHVPDFSMTESEFLISCLNRHRDWAVIVCLIGGGQEINTGEAGIKEWFRALLYSFPEWEIYVSPHLTDSEYDAEEEIGRITPQSRIHRDASLHLAVSMRSFRAENVSLMVKQILDLKPRDAKETFEKLKDQYPIALTRNLSSAKKWLKEQARGTERYGIVVSSQAERLKPYAIDVRSEMDPVHWFLDGKEDVRSSYYLEDVATEFDIQGLELDWACVTWDADFRYSHNGWEHRSFVGDRWYHIRKIEKQIYQKNAYRVLLTRARQGMVIVVPEGDPADPTRDPSFYNPTFEYLKSIGFDVLEEK